MHVIGHFHDLASLLLIKNFMKLKPRHKTRQETLWYFAGRTYSRHENQSTKANPSQFQVNICA